MTDKTNAGSSNTKLPCPFCGDRDIRTHHRGHPLSGQWVVECHSCSCELTGFASETEAWARWNKRAAPETPQPASKDEVAAYMAHLAGCFRSSIKSGTRSMTMIMERDAKMLQAAADMLGTAHETPVDQLDAWALKADNDRLRGALNSALTVLQGVLGPGFRVEPLPQDRPAQETNAPLCKADTGHDHDDDGKCIECGVQKPDAQRAFRDFVRTYGLARETVVALAQDIPTYESLQSSNRAQSKASEPHTSWCNFGKTGGGGGPMGCNCGAQKASDSAVHTGPDGHAMHEGPRSSCTVCPEGEQASEPRPLEANEALRDSLFAGDQLLNAMDTWKVSSNNDLEAGSDMMGALLELILVTINNKLRHVGFTEEQLIHGASK